MQPHDDAPVQSWSDTKSNLLLPLSIRNVKIGRCEQERGMTSYGTAVAMSSESTPATGLPLRNNVITGPPPPSISHPLPPVVATAGFFDVTFATNGLNITTPGTQDSIISIVILPDDRIVVGGSSTIDGVTGFAISRYSSDGIIDPSFGTDGYNFDTIGTKDQINSLALQSDGKIVAGGFAQVGNPAFTIARYNSDGSLDKTFGNNGFSTITPGDSAQMTAIAIQPDGKILAGGPSFSGGSAVFTIARYNSNGSLDSSFGINGYNTTEPVGGSNGELFCIALQQDGKVVAGGTARFNYNPAFTIARYLPDGSIDQSFGTDGFCTISPGSYDGIYSLLIQSDGKIVAGGYAYADTITFGLTRYNTDGSVDMSFGTDGYSLVSPGTYDYIKSMAFQSDGKIVAGGYATDTDSGNNVFAVVRYNPDGSLDTTFGNNGFNTASPGDSDQLTSLALQSDGKIVAGGFARLDGNNIFALVRYISGGAVTTQVATVASEESVITEDPNPLTPPPLGPPPPQPTTTTTTHKPTTTTTTTHTPKTAVTTTTTTHKPTTTTTTHKPTTTTTTHKPTTTTTTTHPPKKTTTTTEEPEEPTTKPHSKSSQSHH